MSEEVMRWSLHQVPATKAPKMLERRDGMWVLHEDHQKALAAAQSRLSEAVKVLERLAEGEMSDTGHTALREAAKDFITTLGGEK